jgi:hypothetical protein
MSRAKKNWMADAFAKNKGALHRDLGAPQGKKIPAAKMQAAAHKPGKVGMRARAAINANK